MGRPQQESNLVEGYSQQTQRNPDVQERGRMGKNSINREFAKRNQVQQDAVDSNSNFGIRQEALGRDATNNALRQETRQDRSRQTPTQEGYQDATTREETININNRQWIQNIHREYSNDERNISSDRQFFAPQGEHTQGGRKSKAVQVDHMEEQYIISRNMFSGKNPLCIEETERPVFVNNYYAGDNPQQMFCEIRENHSGKKR